MWAVQLGVTSGNNLPAQILVGTDCAALFPISVTNSVGTPFQTKSCCLKRSLISGRYILFGSSELHNDLIKVDFPEEKATAFKTYLFLDGDDDYDITPWSLNLSFAAQISPLPVSSIADIEEILDVKEVSKI